MNAYQAYRELLFARADVRGIPLSGTFELTPRCNFNCKMCYIHRSEQDTLALAGERSATQWLSLAEECCKQGTLLLLLTGGEPFIRKDFQEIYSGCRKMGLMISINSNGSLIQEDVLDFLAADPPSRVNITIYGASPETYGALCGNPDAYFQTVHAIEKLQEAGILVKLNYSVTPYNRQDAQAVYAFAREHSLPLQAASYMFPPIRACEHGSFCADRLSPDQAAAEKIAYDMSRFTTGELKERWTGLLSGEPVPDPDDECQELPTQKLRCRAGSSTFWVTWDHQLRPCGMMTEPSVDLSGISFAEGWERIHRLREEIMVPAKCTACPVRNACDQCAAVCYAESGSYTTVPEFMCQMTEAYLTRIRKQLDDV